MEISEQVDVTDRIEVLANGVIQVREATRVMRDGVIDLKYAPQWHRYVLSPGDDLTGKDPRIVAIAQATWTPDVVSAWQAAQAQVDQG